MSEAQLTSFIREADADDGWPAGGSAKFVDRRFHPLAAFLDLLQ